MRMKQVNVHVSINAVSSRVWLWHVPRRWLLPTCCASFQLTGTATGFSGSCASDMCNWQVLCTSSKMAVRYRPSVLAVQRQQHCCHDPCFKYPEPPIQYLGGPLLREEAAICVHAGFITVAGFQLNQSCRTYTWVLGLVAATAITGSHRFMIFFT